MEGFYSLLGIAMLYSMGHFALIQHAKDWSKRTGYERAVTVFALITIAMMVLTIMFD